MHENKPNKKILKMFTKQSKRQKLEERVIFFMNNNHSSKNNKTCDLSSSSKTPKDFNVNLNMRIMSNKSFFQENKKKPYSSALEVNKQIYNKKPINFFPINKEIGKFAEPRFKINNFEKLSPKFYKSIEVPNCFASQSMNHEITNSEIESMEIDEQIPQKKIDQLESNRLNYKINNIFPFHFLIEVEKCYQEISKDLKGNGKKNLDYKIKIAATYLNILTSEENIIYNLFYYHKDINKFFIRELCIFLVILFLNDFSDIQENDISDLNNCITYSHLNFLFIILLIINKTDEKIYKDIKNNKENPLQNNSYIFYQKCKTIIELNNDKIDEIKFKQNFRGHNKIIKCIIINLLTNLSYVNPTITENIFEIFNLAKTKKIKDIIFPNIHNNILITDKISKIIKDSLNPENTLDLIEESQEILKQPDAPYFPPKKNGDKREYCLVLDLDETLVHYFEDENESYVKVRMGTEKFIRELSKYCEIAIFTASTKYYADIVIDGLDCNELIDYRLYREHTTITNGINIKDLSRLGRDLNKIIIIDNIEENFQLQPNNGLNISDFEGDENDNELEFLLKDLIKIVQKKECNLYEELAVVRRNMQKRYTNLS